MNRRNFIKVAGGTIIGGMFSVNPLAWAKNGRAPIILTASNGTVKFSPTQETATKVMHYNNSIPGPIIRVPQGEESVIQFTNHLQEATSIHWHGLRIANNMDGIPGMTQQPIQPGEKFEYRITPPDAGTYWYHTHQRAWEQLTRGLAGILIVEEDNPPQVDQDLIFAVDDWRLDQNLQIDEESLGSMHDWAHSGRMGNVATVNGKFGEQFNVSKGERIRLRVINISNSRTMQIKIKQPNIHVIAIDGQPVTPYQATNNGIIIASGQRYDLIFDITATTEDSSYIDIVVGDKSFPIAKFKYGSGVKRTQLLNTPIALPDNPVNKIKAHGSPKQIPLRIEGGAMGSMQSAIYQGKKLTINELIQKKQIWSFNGFSGLPDEPLFKVNRGQSIALNIDNDNAWPHAIHIHGHHFKSSKSPDIWRDTELVQRKEKIVLNFIADNPGKWLIHCHMIEHQAGGMVSWFEVT